VGKTNIINRYAYNKFRNSDNSTIGLEFVSKAVKVENQEIRLQIWDTAGSERFRALNRSFYRHALGAVIVFSLDNRKSFVGLRNWIAELRENTMENLVTNQPIKIDHIAGGQQVRREGQAGLTQRGP
jgi:small GTP-binding protein